MLQLNTLVRFIHSHSPARLSKFKKILARRPKSVPTPALEPSFVSPAWYCVTNLCLMKEPVVIQFNRKEKLLLKF